MAYVVHLVERDCVPVGRDWMLVEEPAGGDVCLVIARDAEQIELPPPIVDALADCVYRHFRVIPQEPRNYRDLLVG